MYIFIIFFLIFLLDFIVTINIIQLLAAILIRINYLSIYLSSISSDSVYDSVAYDPVKTGLSESEAEAEEPTNRKARNQTLSLVYSSASACDSDNAIFT